MTRKAILLLVFLLPAAAWAQKPSSDRPARVHSDYQLKTFTLVKIDVVGSERFRRDEIVAATGLKLNEETDSDRLQQASDRLGNSGMFSTVQYQFVGVPNGVMAVFKVRDNAQVLPVIFQNFVWFSDEALVRELHARLPLFQGQLPAAGSLQDEVQQALEQILRERGVAKPVRTQMYGALGQAPGAVLFEVEGLGVRVGNVTYTGVGAFDPSLLDKAAEQLLAGPYLRTYTRNYCPLNFLPLYLERGYLRAECGQPELKLQNDSATPVVALTFPIREGSQYTLEGLYWSGNAAFLSAELAHEMNLPLGQVANFLKLQEELRKVHALYGTRGYVGVRCEPHPIFTEGNKVTFQIEVQEGERYRMGSFSLAGLDPVLAAKLQAAYQLRPGDIYDSSYPKRYVQETMGMMPYGTKWEYVIREVIDDEKKVVDVSIDLHPKRG